MITRGFFLCCLSACSLTAVDLNHGGTSVGNPNMEGARVRVDILQEDSGFLIEQALYPVESVDLVGCEHQVEQTWAIERDVALDGSWLEAPPPGAWCEQVWVPSGNVVILGSYEGTTFRFELAEPHVRLFGPWEVEADQQYLVEVGSVGWLENFKELLEKGSPIDLGPDHWLHDPLRMQFELGANMWWDKDGDGEVSEQERQHAYVAGGRDSE